MRMNRVTPHAVSARDIDRHCRIRSTLPAAMEGHTDRGTQRRTPIHRVCARRGCGALVKKATAKYCSVRCCAIDPERLERLRAQARRSARPLALSHQLSLDLPTAEFDPEAELAALCREREDVPAGMSRLAG